MNTKSQEQGLEHSFLNRGMHTSRGTWGYCKGYFVEKKFTTPAFLLMILNFLYMHFI